jgi:hypothetical protein
LEQDGPFQGFSFRRPVTKVYVVVAVNIDIPHAFVKAKKRQTQLHDQLFNHHIVKTYEEEKL